VPLETLNGIQLYYETHGAGPALVFVHGMTFDHREWDEQVAAFQDRYTVVTYDQRGHGQTESPGQYGVEPDAADLEALLDHLGLVPAHVVGLSRGAAIAVSLALRNPALVHSLVLADPYIAGHVFVEQLTDPPYWRVARGEGAEAARRVWLTGPPMARAVADPALRPRIEAMVQAFSVDMWLKGGREPDHLSRLGEVTATTLALDAEYDPQDFKTVADLCTARMPDARRATVPNAGHASNMENPEAFNRILSDFLEEVEILESPSTG
jgi:3-oxoadipate enol-lactonase